MPTSSVGRTSSARGVTLLEMMVVVALIALMTAISFPAIASGLDSLRLNAASQSVVSFLNSGLNHAERRQQVVEVTVSKEENALYLRSTDPGFVRKLDIPEGVSILKILPELPGEETTSRSFMLYPGGTVPPIGLLLQNKRNVLRVIQVDPMTGVPSVSQPAS